MDIAKWLSRLGLQQYERAFRANDIAADVLTELTEADLERLGIASLGHRKRLLKAIAELRAPVIPAQDAVAPPAVSEARAEARTAERRQLTVLFCDLVGSTALASRLDPEDLREVMAAYRETVAAAIGRFGGYVAKYMGDGVLAYFGYPQAHEDDAERAVRSGLVLVNAVASLTTAERLSLRVGIATGLVVVGDLIGSGEAQERGVLGDTPNLAARLQALAAPNAVVIASGTHQLLGGLFEYLILPPAQVKGFAKPIQAYRVLGPSKVESRFEALHAASIVPLVGRDEEVELLLRRWRRAKAGEGQVVLISGEPGIGKSRLGAELQERIAGEPHLRLRYFCWPYHSGSALYPIISQLERAAEFDPTETALEKLAKLQALLAPASATEDDLRLLSELLSIADERHPPLPLSPQARKERIFALLLRLLESLAARQPLMIFFEDVHWIDPTSRELLDLLVMRAARLPILLLITFRPEFQSSWAGPPHVSALVLNRLYHQDGAALVRQVLGTASLPGGMIEKILERTDGVPLFVEELTRAVLDNRNEALGQDAALAAPASLPRLPATLHASLLARLDRLGPVAKEMAQIGSAMGREFSFELISAVAHRSQGELRDALDQLATSGLVSQRGLPPDATFLFKHALIQDAAYSTLLRDRKKEWHARIAAALQSLAPGSSAARPEMLAHHLTEAGKKSEAKDLWTAAGDRALRQAANREAAGFYEHALACRTEQPKTPDAVKEEVILRRKLHQALYPIGELRRAHDNLIEAMRIAERLEDPVPLCRVLSSLTYLLSATGDHSAAIATGERALSLLTGHDDFEATVGSQLMLARALYATGRYREAVRRARDAVKRLGGDTARGAAAGAGGLNQTISAHVWLTLCLAELGELQTGAMEGERALQLAGAAECGEHEQVWSRLGLGRLRVLSGDFAGAIDVLTPALPLCRGEFAIYFSRVASALGAAYAASGRIGEGLDLLRRADARALEIGFTFGHALVLAQMAEALLVSGDAHQAQETGLRALETAQRWAERGNEGWAISALGAVAAARKDHSEARARYQEALFIAEQLEMAPLRARCQEALGRLTAGEGA